jgi:uncharacterized membrane protein YdjX (TVP38/TMEM64 family)
MKDEQTLPQSPRGPSGAAYRWLPLVLVAGVAAVVLATGWHDRLSFKTIGLNYEALRAFVAGHMAAALAVFIVTYVAVVALSLPCASIMTLAGGLLFGWKIAVPAAVVAATAGATILFLVARSSLGEALAARAGPAIASLRRGFREDAMSYMLFLRLVPVFPFVVVNLAAALLGVPLATYLVATFFGIIPVTAAYAVAGAGLGSVIEAQNAAHRACLAEAGPHAAAEACPYTIDTSALVTRELVVAFVLAGLVALLPVVLKKWKSRNAAV